MWLVNIPFLSTLIGSLQTTHALLRSTFIQVPQHIDIGTEDDRIAIWEDPFYIALVTVLVVVTGVAVFYRKKRDQ